MTTPNSRTLALLRRRGFTAAVVERWIPRVRRRLDLFGVGDVLAVHPQQRVILLVQATSRGHVGDRLKRARSRPELAAWLAAGGLFQVWGWAKVGRRWTVKVVVLRPADLDGAEPGGPLLPG
jgi:hypothetical protein